MAVTTGVVIDETPEEGVPPGDQDYDEEAQCGCVGPGGGDERAMRGLVRTAVGKARDVTDEVRLRLMLAAAGDDGMSTVEYAIGTIAAAAFGAVLYQVVTGDDIVSALTGIIDDALATSV